jgi:hypothetical protein
MAELRRDPSPNELLDRIMRLEGRFGRLEDRVSGVAEDLNRLAKSVLKGTEQDEISYKICRADIRYAFERIKDLEFAAFPNLAADISRLYEITGEGDTKAYNPLDRRSRNPF